MEVFSQVMHLFVFISMALLAIGLVFFYLNKTFHHSVWFPLYFMILLGFELYAFNQESSNLYLFSIASFLNFAFIFYFYFKFMLHFNLRKVAPIIILGIIPMIIGLSNGYTRVDFQSYDRFLYSLSIMILSLYTFYHMLNKEEPVAREQLILNSSVLLFFTVDSFLAVGTNYLVNERLMLVAWFWFLRVILLQIFYGSIIYYAWQIGKTR